jgi:hypothetical protein
MLERDANGGARVVVRLDRVNERHLNPDGRAAMSLDHA